MPAYKDTNTGTWFCKFYYKDWKGERHQKWKRGFRTRAEALAYEKDFEIQKMHNTDMTFGELYNIYIADMATRLKASTIFSKRNVYETKILPHFEHFRLNDIAASDIRQWQQMLLSKNIYSETYLKNINTQLVAIINYAHRFYGLETNPCMQAGSIGKSSAEEMQYWTLDEYKCFRKAIADKATAYLCFEILYWTGMREGELLALTGADILYDKKCISINKTYQRIHKEDVIGTPKTRKSKRLIPIPSFLLDEIAKYIAELPEYIETDRLFPYTKSFLIHEMERGCSISGVKKIRIHDIRHSHASLLINLGYDALLLAERLGHEKVSTTLNTYSHLFPHKQASLVATLEKMESKRGKM